MPPNIVDVIPLDIESGNELRIKGDDDDRSGFSRVTAIQAFRNVAAATFVYNRNRSFPILICLVGLLASGAFLAVGIIGANHDIHEQFESLGRAVVQEFDHSWKDYETGGMWIHEACRDHDINRTKFRELYEHLKAGGLEFQAASFAPNVTAAERPAYEEEVRLWYNESYPDEDYQGFRGFELNDSDDPKSGASVQNRSQQDFYYPVHLIEPVESNQAAIHFDLYSSVSRRKTIHQALSTWKPGLTSRLRLVQETEPDAYSVLLMHPGIPLSSQPDLQARDIASMVIRVPALLKRSTTSTQTPITMYVYDTTSPNQADYLGGVTLKNADESGNHDVEYLPEHDLDALRSSRNRMHEEVKDISSNTWTVVVVAVDGSFEPELIFIVLGGTMIMLGCICLAAWVYSMLRKQAKYDQLKTSAEAEIAASVVENAQKAARNERELNDFIAHEVRNPLAAAMSACSFVMSAVNDETKPFVETRGIVNEDLNIIDSALQFINDLLRNMLDMHRAKSKQLNIDWAPVDIMQDVFKPVDAMLYRRGGDVEIELVCPPNLIIVSDRLRLKQIVLNLGRNALKFVDKGFIRLTAAVMLDGTISLFIEDSGPGIPPEKRKKMFAKFQESLDTLNQGTGIGLSLCLNLVELMGGTICLDEMYDSGIPGSPGARIVIHLRKTPVDLDDAHLDTLHGGSTELPLMLDNSGKSSIAEQAELPKHMAVLFVDDDMVLRKLFARSIRKLCPDWTIEEASNGESALQLVKEDTDLFQLIFVDQYMASVEKQLLGTETVRALRVAGCKARICGLSANDVQNAFEDAGANAFMFKPFPTKGEAMKKELLAILDGYMQDRSSFHIGTPSQSVTSLQGLSAPQDPPYQETYDESAQMLKLDAGSREMHVDGTSMPPLPGAVAQQIYIDGTDEHTVELAKQVFGASSDDLSIPIQVSAKNGEDHLTKIFT
mmetsp:Transcript_17206/g.28580  ORF Transcript_17206/g.28580 Transcript_17206/m.28580 type:complete len:947 (+) Transcript_17206:70-2910(+)